MKKVTTGNKTIDSLAPKYLNAIDEISVVYQFEMLKNKRLYENDSRSFNKQFQASKCLTFFKDAKGVSKLFLKIVRTKIQGCYCFQI